MAYGQSSDIIKKAAEKSGLSENQIKNMARQRGYSDADIKAEAEKRGYVNPEMKQVQNNENPDLNTQKQQIDNLSSNNDFDTKESTAGENPDDPNSELAEELESSEPPNLNLPFFGYDIFKGDPALFQASNFGAIDPNYNIGPGDEIIIMLWGETQFRQSFSVDREGYIFITDIGQIFVNGLNLNALENKIFKRLSKVYSSLKAKSGKATTYLDVSLGEIRPLRVMVLGDVAQPGAYTLNPTTTLFTSLYYFRGPTEAGSLRNIQLIRKGKNIATIDFYNYLLTGKTAGDVRLQLDDVIFIPKRGITVSIEGEVNRNAVFELKEDEELSTLIKMAGGLKNTAYLKRAQIDRIVPFEERNDNWDDRVLEDFDLSRFLDSDQTINLRDGDHIEIFSIKDMHRNDVYISGGAVTRPGRFELVEGMKISNIIEKAGGLSQDAYLDKAHIIRINTKSLREELISIDLGKALSGDVDHDLVLQWMDRIQVFSLGELIPEYSVSILGQVKKPGKYRLLENMKLYDLVFEYGGFLDKEFKKEAYPSRAEIIRVIDENVKKEIIPFNLDSVIVNKGKANLILKPDDVVRIYSQNEIIGETRYVSIKGHVKRPGRYELYEDNMTIYDLLFIAGGFDDPIFLSQIFLDRADLIRFEKERTTKKIISFELSSIIKSKESDANFNLSAGDEIIIYSKELFSGNKFVSINGEVKNPGKYSLKSNMFLKDLILESGGFKDDIYRYRIEIARIDPENDSFDKYAEVITLNMDKKFFSSEITSNHSEDHGSRVEDKIKLYPYDMVTVMSDPYFSSQRIVKNFWNGYVSWLLCHPLSK